jgi:hypothetical protein
VRGFLQLASFICWDLSIGLFSDRDDDDRGDGVARQQRDKLRAERKREREREMRLENLTGKKSKYARDQVRLDWSLPAFG